jgi:hypothetical protein
VSFSLACYYFFSSSYALVIHVQSCGKDKVCGSVWIKPLVGTLTAHKSPE